MTRPHTLPQLPTGGLRQFINKAGYMVTPVTCRWAGAVTEKVTGAFEQERLAQKSQKNQKNKKGTGQPTDGWTNNTGWSCIAHICHATKKLLTF